MAGAVGSKRGAAQAKQWIETMSQSAFVLSMLGVVCGALVIGLALVRMMER